MSAMEDERVHRVAKRAATKFGARFRHSDDFSVEWVEAECDIVRAGRKASPTMRKLYNTVWEIIDKQFPTITWPCWPDQRDLTHGDSHFTI
jgi:hypothetical protein